MQYSRKLGFDETPDYNWLRGLFLEVLNSMDDNDGIYDWQLLNDGKGWQSVVKEKRQSRTAKKIVCGPTAAAAAATALPPNETHQTLQEQAKHHNNSYNNNMKSNSSRRGWAKIKSLLTCGIF